MTPESAAKPPPPGRAVQAAQAAQATRSAQAARRPEPRPGPRLAVRCGSLQGARRPARPFPLLAVALAAALLLAAAQAAPPARAGDEPFTSPSNYGLTGLYEIPTARVMQKHRYRVGTTYVYPYWYFFGSIGAFERLEVNGRITQVLNVPGFDKDYGSGYGDFKDKTIDVKLQLLKEGKYTPAVAVAVSDPHGTRLYASQSIVASKQFFPFDFTIGMGNGRLGEQQLDEGGEGFDMELFTNPKRWWREAQLFGGVQFTPVDWLTLMAEYSPVRYERQDRDPAQPRHFPNPARSRINAGIRLKPFRWAEITAGWQRGEEFSTSASFSFDIGRPILPIHDPPYREPGAARAHPLAERIADALSASGFSDIGVDGDDFSLRIDAGNDRYFFTPTAVKAVVEAVAPMVPPRYEYVRIRIKENGIPMVEFVATAAAMEGVRDGTISWDRFFEVSAFRTEHIGDPVPRTSRRRYFDWTARPSLELYLNDPSHFVSYRFGAALDLAVFPWKGGTAVLGLDGYPLNTVSTSVEPLSIPVRSDVARYKEQNLALGRLMFDQVVKTGSRIYGRASAGLLEIQYAGLDAEAAVPLLRGRLIASAGGSLVRKRSPDELLRMADDTWYKTAFLCGRLNIPEADIWFDVKGGRFLAGDWGTRFQLSKFIRGVTLTAWYTVTDTSVFSDPNNDGYHDKGISVTIPIRLFLGRDSRVAYKFSLSPWTRDAGQDIDHYNPLPDYIGRNTDILLDKDTRDLYKGIR